MLSQNFCPGLIGTLLDGIHGGQHFLNELPQCVFQRLEGVAHGPGAFNIGVTGFYVCIEKSASCLIDAAHHSGYSTCS